MIHARVCEKDERRRMMMLASPRIEFAGKRVSGFTGILNNISAGRAIVSRTE